MLRDEGPLVPMAGCTDLYVSLNFGTLKDTRFLNLWRLAALRTIEMRGGLLSIGALATHTDLIRSPLVRQARADAGGRGARGRRRADSEPRHDRRQRRERLAGGRHAARARRGGRDGRAQERRRDAPRAVHRSSTPATARRVRRPDELIVALEIPAIRGRQCFRKVGTRAAQAISKVVVAAVVGDRPRIALGSVAPTVVRATRTEAALAAGASIEDAQQTLVDEIAPIDDIRSTAEYRRRVAANLLALFWNGASRR